MEYKSEGGQLRNTQMTPDSHPNSTDHNMSSFFTPAYPPFGVYRRQGGLTGIMGKKDMKVGLWRSVAAEFFATAALVFAGVAAIVWGLSSLPFAYANPNQAVASRTVSIDYTGVALVWGIVYFAMLHATQHISGGFLNPAVTFALMLVGKLSIVRAFLYMVAQVGGAIVGVGLVKAASFNTFNRGFGGANVNSGPFSKLSAFYIEIIATAILVWVVLASVDVGHARRPFGTHIKTISPFAVGLAYFALFLITMPVDGGCMNPARSFGSAVILNKRAVWNDQWIFWFGPAVGAIIGALLYEICFRNSVVPLPSSNQEVAPLREHERTYPAAEAAV